MFLVTCSRGRTRQLLRLVRQVVSLRRSGRLSEADTWYIIDDAPSGMVPVDQGVIGDLCAGVDLRVVVVGPGRFAACWATLNRVDGEGLFEHLLREPGRGGWDAAGMRNLAALVVIAAGSEADSVAWMDNDIVLTAGSGRGSRGQRMRPAAVGEIDVFGSALRRLRGCELMAVGVRYAGVADLSIREHVEVAIETLLREGGRSELALGTECGVEWPEGKMPAVMDYTGHAAIRGADGGPAGISAGFMIVRMAALLRAPFPRCYNEDWLWLFMLGDPDKVAAQCPLVVAHLPPARGVPSVSDLAYQECGEIVFESIVGSWTSARLPDSSDRGSWIASEGPSAIEVDEHRNRRCAELLAVEQRLRHLVGQGSVTRHERTIGRLANAFASTRRHLGLVPIREIRRCIQQIGWSTLLWQRQLNSGAVREALRRVVGTWV